MRSPVESEAGVYHISHMTPPPTLETALVDEKVAARNRENRKASQDLKREIKARREAAQRGEIDFPARCPKELDSKKYKRGCTTKNNSSKACRFRFHAPTGHGAPPKFSSENWKLTSCATASRALALLWNYPEQGLSSVG
mgnify:CR=1 FL=1